MSGIAAQLCGLTMMVAILVFNAIHKRIRLKSSDSFIQLVSVTSVAVVLDIAGRLVTAHADDLPELFTIVVYKIHLVTVVTGMIFGVRYLCADMYRARAFYKRVITRVWLLLTVEILSVAVFPIEIIRNTDKYLNHMGGTSVYISYAFSVVNVALIIILLVYNRHTVNTQRKKAIIMWSVTWFLSGVVQLINFDIHSVAFGACLGVMIIYFSLENPEANLDRITGFFNESTFSLMCDQFFIDNTSFAAVLLSFSPVGGNTRVVFDKAARKEIDKYLSDIKTGEVFRISDMEMAIIFEDKSEAADTVKLIKERFGYGWGEHNDVYSFMQYVFIPDSSVFDNFEIMSRAIQYAKTSIPKGQDSITLGRMVLEEMRAEYEMEETIRYAIDNSRVEVFYMPLYSVKDKKFSAAEALVRIRKPDGTIVMPDEFIPVAEKNGTIIKIGEIVFEKVCQILSREMLHERFDIKCIGINLSSFQCAYENLADSFISTMNLYHVDPSWINFEITESGTIYAKSTLLKNMQELKLYGVSFSLDGFGTGQSNFNYIFDIPIETVKFDRELTNTYFIKDSARFVTDGMIRMFNDMGLKVVVQGAETKEQVERFITLDVDYIQGYYYSKPLPSGEYLSFLAR